MTSHENYLYWRKKVDDTPLKRELLKISGDEQAINERFGARLNFGTAGLRGSMGVGTSRMNIYTARHATQGLADYLKEKYENAAVVVSFDSRNNSELFARETARVLAANGVLAHLTAKLSPTPFLSFLVRRLSCKAGVMVTASHNPAHHNGYKCYGQSGAQLTDGPADEIFQRMQKLDYFEDVKLCDFDEAVRAGKIFTVDEALYEEYLQCVVQQVLRPEVCHEAPLRVVYTPLNGAGKDLVLRVLDQIGVKDVNLVQSQAEPDGDFPTCRYPNPEDLSAMQEAFKLALKVHPDVILATDPDADRMSAAFLKDGKERLLTGNEIGILLTHYILNTRRNLCNFPKNGVIVKSIVSSDLAQKIAENYECSCINVLTGFKYIGEQIENLVQDGRSDDFVFAFEESYGYLAGTHARDKDAVLAVALFCEMVSFHKKCGKTIFDALREIYEEFGYSKSKTLSFDLTPKAAIQLTLCMQSLREAMPKIFGGFAVLAVEDYLAGEKIFLETGEKTKIKLPRANVLKICLEGGHSVIVRPSGTEPKVKIYVSCAGDSEKIVEKSVLHLEAAAKSLFSFI